jgi:hypothetical protein
MVKVKLEDNEALQREIQWMESLTEEDHMKFRTELAKISRPARPLPEGKTLAEVVQANWPGDESDEEVKQALEKLS